MALDESINPIDVTPDVNGVPFIYPEHMTPYLDGVIFDAEDRGGGLGIVIRSPIPGGSCGDSDDSCGTGC